MSDDLLYIIYELIDILQYLNFGYDCNDINTKLIFLFDYVKKLEKKDRD